MISKVGFIGLGLMGRPMASRLLAAGYSLTVHSRSQGPVKEMVAKGAHAVASPKEVASNSEVVITMLPDSPEVEAVILGESGLIEGGHKDMNIIDMSTISYEATVRISTKLMESEIHMLDAPVSGGVWGAENGSLTIMVGGEEKQFQECLPILQKMGSNIVRMGSTGLGQVTKLCNQIMVSLTLQGVCEALTLASKAGLDLKKLVECLEKGAAGSWQLSNLAPRIIKRDFAPGFKARHQRKDLGHTLSLANTLDVSLPTTSFVSQFYKALESQGLSDNGTQAVITILESLSSKE